MDILSFIIELTKAIIWPIITIIILFTLKSPLSKLIRHTQNIKYKDVEIQFKEEVQELSIDVEKELSDSTGFNLIEMIKRADNDPKFAIITSWQKVFEVSESIVTSKFPEVDLSIEHKYKLIQETLINNNILNNKSGEIFNEIRNLRNKVKHAKKFHVDKDDAVQYIAMCSKLISYLNKCYC